MKKKLYVGADPFPPYQYYDKNGSVIGSDYDIVKKTFDTLGYEIEVILDNSSIVEQKLIEGSLDVAFQFQKTDEREKKYSYSKLLRNAVTEFVTSDKLLKVDKLSSIAEMKLTVGVIENYSYGDDIDKLDSNLKISFEDHVALLHSISDNKVCIGIFDKGVKEYIAKEENIKNIYSLENLEFIRPLYVVFNKSSLRDEFDSVF